MPRPFRESPVNAIWEGSGNIQCLDVLRAMAKTPAVLDAYFDEVAKSKGTTRSSTVSSPRCAANSPIRANSSSAPERSSTGWRWRSRRRCSCDTRRARSPTRSARRGWPMAVTATSAPCRVVPTARRSSRERRLAPDRSPRPSTDRSGPAGTLAGARVSVDINVDRFCDKTVSVRHPPGGAVTPKAVSTASPKRETLPRAPRGACRGSRRMSRTSWTSFAAASPGRTSRPAPSCARPTSPRSSACLAPASATRSPSSSSAGWWSAFRTAARSSSAWTSRRCSTSTSCAKSSRACARASPPQNGARPSAGARNSSSSRAR